MIRGWQTERGTSAPTAVQRWMVMGMREILFRGKPLNNGKFVFGCYYKQSEFYGDKVDDHIIITSHEDLAYDQQLDYCDVKPETVGQFTGLTDKNGKKIFEGDVVNAVIVRDMGGGTKNREETGIIGYDKIGMIGLILEYADTIPVWSDFFQELTLSGGINDFWFEVIGNIHDNPELIGGKGNA